MRKIVVYMLMAVSGVSTAFAASMSAQSGIYVGGAVGWSSASAYGPGLATNLPTTDVESKADVSLALQGVVGYNYAFTPHWMAGVETSYLYMGKNTYSFSGNIFPRAPSGTVVVNNSGVQLMATGTYLASGGFNTFAKAGAVYENTSVTGTPSDVTMTNGAESQSGWLPAVDVGMGYMWVQNFNIALQYEHIFGGNWGKESQPSKPTSVNMVTLGVTYTFPL